MRAAVKTDRTVRTILLEVSEVPDIDVTRSYHRKPRIFRPDHVTITLTDGRLSHVTAKGGLVLKSGGASDSAMAERTWHGPGGYSTGGPLSEAPEWVQLLAREAPAGVTGWGLAAEEVQAL